MAQNQIKIDLLFNANIQSAKNNIQELSFLLNQISTNTNIGINNANLIEGVKAAQMLQTHLQNAVNVDTGKLDLIKLQTNLKTSGTNVQTLANQIRSIGPIGEQAFLKFANAISQAQVPMVKANGLIKNFMITLANTAKWQIASTAIHGVIGAFQGATSHIKDFNKALTDIQIVTGYSAQSMASLAQQATEAAKALNTTSTEYAKAALIFYQQGLSGEQVTERANVVIKLSQVTGQTAQTVSDQMTAIWNNFAKGSDNLEYFADALTKLGAATAASTDEISQGLEKFASIGETVGLSYEYAAASVATVVDKTRQSAEIVGTSFKTIFARMQGLSLGETLEDGVDLNKYSEALATVGINVLDASGNLRDMDNILDELGEKWQLLGSESQVALAQTVGGIRQYNQMVALMDNWEEVKENINIAKESTGELAKQQEIWTKNYEASTKRLAQAKNELYESFINEDFLMGWNDGFTVLIKTISTFIENIGGIGPLLISILGIFSSTFFPLIQAGITKISSMISIGTGSALKQVSNMQSSMSASMGEMLNNSNLTQGMKNQIVLSQQLLIEKNKLMLASKRMTETEKIEAESRMNVIESLTAETMKTLQHQDALEKSIKSKKEVMNQGKTRWNVARNVAENNIVAEDEEEKSEIIEMSKKTNIMTDYKSAKNIQSSQQFLNDNKEEYNRIKQKGENHEAYTKDEQRLLSKYDAAQKTVSAENKKRKDSGLPEVTDEYIAKLEKVKSLQSEILDLSRQGENTVVGKVAQNVDSIEGGSDINEVKKGQMSNLAAASDGAINYDSETNTMSIEASIANYEKLYEALGKQKVLESELAAAMEETSIVKSKSKEKTAELIAAEKNLNDYEKKLEVTGKGLSKERKNELKTLTTKSKEYKKLSKEEKAYVKLQEKVNTATVNSNKAQKDVIKQFAKSQSSYEELAKKSGATSEQLTKLKTAFSNLETETGDSDANLNEISAIFADLGFSANDVAMDLTNLGADMKEMLIQAGYSDEEIEQLTAELLELANTAPQAENGIKNINNSLTGIGSKPMTLSTAFGNLAQSAMTMVGGLMSLSSGMNSFISAFDEGASASERMTGILSGLMGMLPMIITLTKVAADTERKKTGETLKGIGANIAAIVTGKAKTAGTWADTIANIANLLSSPWTMALAAVAIIAITAVTASMSKHTEQTQADTEANIENAESANELSAAWAESSDAMDTVIAKFEKLAAAGKDTKDAIQDLIDTTPDLVQAYRDAAEDMPDLMDEEQKLLLDKAEYIEDLIKALEKASTPESQAEIVEKIKAAQSEADSLMSETAYEQAKKGANAAASKTALAISEDGGADYSDDEVTRHVGGTGTQTRKDYGVKDSSGNTVTLNEDEASVDILMQKFENKRNVNRANGYDVKLDASSSESFVEDYEKLKEAAQEMEDQLGDQLDDSDVYREIKEMLDAGEEDFKKLKELQAEVDKYGVYDVKDDLKSKTFASGESMEISNISSLKEYEEYKNALLEGVGDDPAAQATAEQWLEANESVKEYADALSRIELVEKDAGWYTAKNLKDLYGKLSEEDQSLFLNVDFNTYQSVSAVKAEIERLQHEADKEEIQIKTEAISTAQGSLKEGMTEEDWTKIKDSGIKWGEDGIVEFNDFINMTFKDQEEYLNKLKLNTQNDLVSSTKNTIQEMEESLKNVKDEGEKKVIQENIDKLYDDLAIYKEVSNAMVNETLNSAESLTELQQAWDSLLKSGTEVSYDIYAQNLMRLAEAYSICSDEIRQFNSTLEYSSMATDAIVENYGSVEALTKDLEWNKEQLKMLKEEFPQYSQEEQDAYTEDLKNYIYEDDLKEHGFEGVSIDELTEEQQNKILDAEFGFHDWDGMVQQSYDELETIIGEQEALLEDYNAMQEKIKEAQEALEAEVAIGEAAEKYDLNADELSVQAQQLRKEYNLTAKQASKLAIQNQRMNKGVSSMVDNWKDWSKALKTNNKTSQDWAKAAAECTKAIADLVGASEDLVLPDSFFDSAENLNLLEQAAQGSEEAINQLGVAVFKSQIEMMNYDGLEDTLGALQFNEAKENVLKGIETLQSAINDLEPGQDITELLQADNWIESLNTMAEATNMTVEEMNSMLDTLGVEANVEVQEKEVETKVPKYTTVMSEPVETEKGTESTSYTYVSDYEPVTTTMQIASIGNEENPPKISFVGNGGVSDSAKQGSGGSSSKTKDSRKKKTDIVDRYKEVNDELEETNRLMEKNSTLAEGMWGSDKIAKMKESVSLMKQENETLKKKIGLAKQYLAEDKTDLQSAAAAAGVGFTFNEDGNITNYTDQMTALYERRESLLNSFGEEMNEDQKKTLDALDEQIDDLTSAYEQYETTLDEVKDWEQEQLEKELAIQQKNFDILNEELEVKLSINETDMARIDYYLNKIADDFYQMAEAAALMVGDLSKEVFGGQMGNYISNLEAQEKYMDDLETQFKNGDINQAQYIEGLQNSQSAIIDNLNSINELDKTMLNYYGDTLAVAGEELAKYTDRMEHQSSVLEHYFSIMEIMGKSKDYEKMGVILKGQATAAEDQMKVAKANYEMYMEQEKVRKEELDNAIARGASEAEIEVLKKNWEAASDAADEAQEEMLSKTEAWAEAMRAAVENELNGLAQTLENALTADFGGSFDSLATQMEHANSLQEEYLTTTNKIYETNKMMRTAQQEIDKSTNSVAKKKLKSFINETEQLQNQTKLSKYELEIQQAKYDLLLAEIALEEAQGAKSTVRLQRDSEGNFGYVYTADQNAIAEAEQKFADAQNSLYNIGLEGANQYTEKYQQTLSEFYNTMTELQMQYLNGEFENEQEYQAAMEEAKSFYYTKLQEYSELYTVAIGTDARVVQDAWSTEFQTMTYGTEKWKTSIETYIGNVNTAFGTWETVTNRLAEETVGKDLETLKGKVTGITDESKLLVSQITGENGVINALGAEADAVATTTGKYASMREEIQNLRTEYEKLLEQLNTNINNEYSGNSIGGTGDGSSDGSGDFDGSGLGSGSGGGSLNIGDSVTVKSSATTFSRDGGNGIQMQSWVPGSSFSVYGSDDDEVLIGDPGRSGVYTGWVRKTDLVGFATGGYTGEWGSYGKLAMLHEKELVLNQKETENFLASMELLDSIVKTIDLYSTNAQYGGLLSTPTFGGHNSEPIEQNVHIEAHFPEATDRNEITEAINTLVNQASQFVNRK